ncbi:MAG TPA: SAM-dependent methyltransferase [Streptosporangiaceae bacterium]|nr:SAM-dependent methyltransferase [Streptosporangiaceae bacterium]
MADDRTESVTVDVEIDTGVAHPARVYDYWLGGKTNFAADRAAAEQSIAANPAIVPAVRANRAFLGRAVRHLVAAGVDQFLDIGTGIPTEGNTHEVAQAAASQARVVYVDNDPIVLAHAHKLLRSTPQGRTAYISGDLRHADAFLRAAAGTLDFTRPVGVMLVATLQYLGTDDDPYGVVAQLMASVSSGSHLVISHPASDIGADRVAASMRRYNERAAVAATPRTRAGVTRFFDGLELLEPGVVQLPKWRPDPDTADSGPLPMWCGAGRKR